MYKNLVNNIIYWISIVFLVGSIYVFVFHRENFTWQSLFGTDGLTLLGLLITLLFMIMQKIRLVRRGISWLLLTTNYNQLDYRFESLLITYGALSINDLINTFRTSLSNCGLFTSNTLEINRNTQIIYKVYHRGMAANFYIRKIPSDAEEILNTDNQNGDEESKEYWKIGVDGVSTFRIVNKNIAYVLNHFMEQLVINHRANPVLINLNISNTNTEYDLSDKGILLSRKEYNIGSAYVEIQSINSSRIIIDNNTGIFLTSRSRGDFISGLDILKNVLIS